MRNFQVLFFIWKRSSPCSFLIFLTIPLTGTITIKISLLCNTKNATVNNKSAMHLRFFKEGLVLISAIFVRLSLTFSNGSGNSSKAKTTSSSFGLVLVSSAVQVHGNEIGTDTALYNTSLFFLKRHFLIYISSSTTLFSIDFIRCSGENTLVILKQPKEVASINSNNFCSSYFSYLRNNHPGHSSFLLDQCRFGDTDENLSLDRRDNHINARVFYCFKI